MENCSEVTKIKIDLTGNLVELDKVLNPLDELALKFTGILTKKNVKYVVISGYVPILFGRNRASEDVDVLIPRIEKTKFNKLWDNLREEFWCINTGDVEEAYDLYLSKHSGLRFAFKEEILPNIELKTAKTEPEKLALKENVTVKIKNHEIHVSGIELQIAYKLWMAGDLKQDDWSSGNKDIEDAVYLYRIFYEHLNRSKLNRYLAYFKIKDYIRRLLDETD